MWMFDVDIVVGIWYNNPMEHHLIELIYNAQMFLLLTTMQHVHSKEPTFVRLDVTQIEETKPELVMCHRYH
jgi:hypothetical protein